MRDRAARAADLTMDKVAAVVSRAIDGDVEISERQLAAAEKAVKILRPTLGNGAPITINQQNNFNGPSPYANLDRDGLLGAMREVIQEMNDNKPGD